mmetsp:Transcript_51249/g.111410  ORF Transcript_51249/g.111410 Transcript_51249/m.111410 type:complete len:212 (-) Transcript_51249:238-873(-)
MRCATLNGVRFGAEATLDKVNLDGSVISDSNLGGASFRGSSLKSMKVENSIFDRVTLGSGTWFEGSYFFHCSFALAQGQGSNFDGSTLDHCSFRLANLDGASIRNCVLPWFELHGGSANAALFDGSDLSFSDFTRASVQFTSFKFTKLADANFHLADVTGADFWEAEDTDLLDGFSGEGAVNLPLEGDVPISGPPSKHRFIPPRTHGVSIC